MTYLIFYISGLFYVLGLTFSVYPFLHQKRSILQIIILLCVYSILYFLISQTILIFEQSVLIYVLTILLDWLMMSWLYGKLEKWIMFYTTFYLCQYLIVFSIITQVLRTVHLQPIIFVSLLANVIIVVEIKILNQYHMMADYKLVQEHELIYDLINFLMISIVYIFYSFKGSSLQSRYIIFIYLLLMSLWIYLLMIMSRSFCLAKEKAELKVMNIYNQNVEDYVMRYMQNHEQIRKLRHDLKNHLFILKNLDNTQQIHEYLDQLSSNMPLLLENQETLSGNPYIDACLNIKKQTYPEVKFQWDLQVQDLNMPCTDLCSLLFNLLDNGATAAMKVQGSVELQMIYNQGNLLINVSNDCYEEPDFTSHEDNHGYGLKIIHEIVYKYKGAIEMRYTDHKLYVEICLEV